MKVLRLKIIFGLLSTCLVLVDASKVRYDNVKVFKIKTKCAKQRQVIEELAENMKGVSSITTRAYIEIFSKVCTYK